MSMNGMQTEPLHSCWQVKKGIYPEIVQLLLQHPAVRVNVVDNIGRTAHFYAVNNGNDDIATLLVRHGANPVDIPNVPVGPAVAVIEDEIPAPALAGVLRAPTERALEIHNNLQYNTIEHLTTLAECTTFYDNNAYYKECLRLLRSSQRAYMSTANEPSVEARETWSHFWANARHEEQDWARALDDCRKTGLTLLYKVCNLATNPDGTFQAERIVEVFQMRRMMEILVLCLAMDRANCLYNMSITATGERGLGWYARGQEQKYQALRTPPLPLNPSEHTINKRLVRLQGAFFQETR